MIYHWRINDLHMSIYILIYVHIDIINISCIRSNICMISKTRCQYLKTIIKFSINHSIFNPSSINHWSIINLSITYLQSITGQSLNFERNLSYQWFSWFSNGKNIDPSCINYKLIYISDQHSFTVRFTNLHRNPLNKCTGYR